MFTKRQKKYAEDKELQSVYTPQMIVNGSEEFVGSDREYSKKCIAGAHKQKPLYQITIKDLKMAEGRVHFHYSIDRDAKDEVINIAIVEASVENYVSRGENNGKKLRHDNVVQYFETNLLEHEADVKLKIPKMTAKNASIVLYIQDKNWRVLGASSKSLY